MKNIHLWLLSRADWEKVLRRELPDYALEHLDPALRDEPKAGLHLNGAAPNDWRGLLAVFFWLHARETQAFRDLLSAGWDHDHREVIAAVGTRRELENMFRDAQFELPDELPQNVTLYRGTSYLPFSMAKRGYSWTTDKQIAAWFAMRFASRNGEPLVLSATVPKSSILLYHDERSEKEAVCFHVRGAKIDGDPEEWQQLADQWEQEKTQSEEDMWQKHKIQFQQDMKMELSRAQEMAIE